MPLPPQEDIVRAIPTEKWQDGHPTPSLFKGSNTSVSRLAVIPLEDHWDVFDKWIAKPPERRVEGIGEINVGTLLEVGQSYQQPIELTVEPKPVEGNPAHAEIPQKISRGLANQILKKLKLHNPPRD
jgi:hypothetical protein